MGAPISPLRPGRVVACGPDHATRPGGGRLNEVSTAHPAAPPPDRLLRRPRVHALLDRAFQRPLILVRAPVGHGKTTAVAHWSQTRRGAGPAVHWIDLAADASRTSVRQLLRVLTDEPAAAELVVLDELHHLDPDLVPDLVGAALRRSGTRLLLISRAVPALPLGLLRSRGQLAELGAGELVFTEEEYRALLRQLGHDPSDRSVADAVEHTHGWPALLRVVADHHDLGHSAHQVATLLADYTETEVLGGLAPDDLQLLGDLAALPRLSVESARAVGGRPDAWARLTALHRAGVPMRWPDARSVELDPVLRQTLTDRLPTAPPERVQLHEHRVIDHLRSSGDGLAAVRWLLTAGRHRRAIDVLSVELLPTLHSDRDTLGELLDRLAHVPDWRVAAMHGYHQLVVAPDRDAATVLETVEALLAASTEQPTAIQADFLEAFRLRMDRHTNYRLGITPDPALGLRLPSLEPADNLRLQRLAAAALRTEQAEWHLHHGSLEQTHLTAPQAATLARLGHLPWVEAQAGAVDALALALLGEHRAARTAANAALDLGATVAVGDGSVLDPARLALAWTSSESSEPAGARTHLAGVAPRGDRPSTAPYLTYLEVMTTALTNGRQAAHLVDAYRQTDPWLTAFQRSLIASAAFRADLAAGDLDRARAELVTLEEVDFPAHRPLVDIGRARLWARSGRARDAVTLLLPYLEDSPRLSARDVIGLMSTLTVAAERSGEPTVARSARERWHAASTRVGLVVDGSRVQQMVRRMFEEQVELSPAERNVLQHLDSDLPLGAVAQRLYISTNTLKTHLRHLYRKLGVSARDEAVQRARGLGLR